MVWAQDAPVDPRVSVVVFVPPDGVATEVARGLLPATVPHADAAANAGRAALLVAALAGQPELLLPRDRGPAAPGATASRRCRSRWRWSPSCAVGGARRWSPAPVRRCSRCSPTASPAGVEAVAGPRSRPGGGPLRESRRRAPEPAVLACVSVTRPASRLAVHPEPTTLETPSRSPPPRGSRPCLVSGCLAAGGRSARTTFSRRHSPYGRHVGRTPRDRNHRNRSRLRALPRPASTQERGGLNAMLLPELKQMAGGLGIKAPGMRKGELIEAIKAAQAAAPAAGGQGGEHRPARPRTSRRSPARTGPRAAGRAAGRPATSRTRPAGPSRRRRPTRSARAATSDERRGPRRTTASRTARTTAGPGRNRDQDNRGNAPGRRPQRQTATRNRSQDDRHRTGSRTGNQDRRPTRTGATRTTAATRATGTRNQNQGDRQPQPEPATATRRRGRQPPQPPSPRPRPRRQRAHRRAAPVQWPRRPRQPQRAGHARSSRTTCWCPSAGILDVLDNYAFVRTSGYLPGTDDVYVSLSMVRKFGLRRGDAIIGQVRQPREGERKEKFNPMVRIDTVNGADPEVAKSRVEFSKLTPLYASERLRLETESTNLIGRVIDIAAPIGKGQRGLIVSPVQGRQDDDHAVDRQLDHDQQPRVPPDGRARGRASGGGHRLRALGQGRGHLLDVRPARQRPHHRSRSWPSSGPSASSSSATTSSCCSTASPAWAAPTTSPPRRAAGSCPVASTRRRSTRRSGSSAPPATSRTAAR